MKKLFLFTLFLFTPVLFAQKEKTLFWEISGNGLAKNSYLYGTMHVNDKVSYHLSDAFFKHLLAADIVSNESDPETWDGILSLLKPSNTVYAPNNFYSAFYMNSIKKKALSTVFVNDNYFANMLSGLEGAQSDFQENTVLDMFIYQTGKKYKKRIVGLESARGSILSIMKIEKDEVKPDEKNIEKLMKIIKNGNFNETLKSYYREKDVVMLDSIYKLMLSKKAHEVIITNRNEVMARSIDSLARTGSLFSAIGAAHLGGKQGVIQLLRNKGYTVNPIIDEISLNGQKQKKTIEEFFPNPGFSVGGTADEMVRMPLNKKIITSEENIGSPDFTNGATINIKRMPLNQFLNSKNERFNPKSLDSLFFENIAGEINEKNYLKEENYEGYDIKNTTKNGNTQHWRFYITPLELITVSMTGSGNYTKQYEKELFDNIKIKPFKNSWTQILPQKGGFSVAVPAFNFIYGNTPTQSNIEIQAFDPSENAYYFVTERTLNNTDMLEDTEFEEKQIQYEFYLQHDIESTHSSYDSEHKTYQSEAKIGTQKIQLKSVIQGAKYYLLGTVNASDLNVSRFFESFKSEKFNYDENYKTFTDTIAKFKIDIPKKQNETLFLDLKKDTFKNKNAFVSKSIDYTFKSGSGAMVNLEYYKYHKYESIQNLDSITAGFKRTFLKEELFSKDIIEPDDDYDRSDNSATTSLLNYSLNSKKGFSPSSWFELTAKEDEKYQIISESNRYDKEKNIHIYDALVSKPNATQAIKYRVFFNEDSNTQLTALVDKNYQNDDSFIEKTFHTFTFLEKNKSSVFDDKLKLFIEDANSPKDTIRYSAMKSVYELEINKNDLETITHFVTTFQFKDNETNAIEALILKIGKIEDQRVLPFLEALYKKESTKTSIQISILEALANQKSKNAYKKIAELLEYDLPLSDNEYSISRLFSTFEDDLENSKELFPKIFQFYSIKEYNEPIIGFCNTLFDANLVSAKKLNTFKKIITTNAKLEYKRILSWKESNPIEEDSKVKTTKKISADTTEIIEADAPVVTDYSEAVETSEAPVSGLLNYLSLLSNFSEDDAIKTLMNKTKLLDLPQLNLELIRLGILNDQWTNAEILEALNNAKTRYATIQLLLYKNKKDLLTGITDEAIAKAAVINFEGLLEKDTITFIKSELVDFNGTEVTYFFYTVARKVAEDEVQKKELQSIAFVNENHKINPIAYKSFISEALEENDDLAKKCQSIITESLNEKHTRATFKKETEEAPNLYPEDY